METQLFNELTESLREAVSIRRDQLAPGRVFVIDPVTRAPRKLNRVTVVRRTTGLTQVEFAALLGVSVRTVRTWESGLRDPRGPASALVELLAHSPKFVLKTLQS